LARNLEFAMAILITGGAGYIGSHTAHMLTDGGMQVIAIDDLSAGFSHLLPASTPLFVGDFGDAEFVKGVLNQHDITAVIHVGGSIQIAESLLNPGLYHRNNVLNTQRLLDVIAEFGIKLFVFSSSCAVYGQPLQSVCNEEDPTHPMSPYAQSKLLAEKLLQDAAAANRIEFVSLRYFNVAGADPKKRTGQSTPAPTHLIRRAVQTAIGMQPALEIYGSDYVTRDGTCIRDYVHVSDVAWCNLAALNYLSNGGQSIIFNCGSGRGVSVYEVIQSVIRVSGRDIPIVQRPRRDGDPSDVIAGSERIRSVLNWYPQINGLDEIVRDTLAWEIKLNERAKP
jgi:UDP-glucose 4-epimerase